MGGIEINGRFLRNVQQLLKLIHPQPQTLNQVQTKSPSNDILKGGKNNALSSISSSFCSKLAGNSITCAALGLASLLGGLGWKWLRFLGFFFLYQKKPLNKTTNWSGGIFFCITCLSACICCRGSDEFPRKREKYLAHLHKEFLSDQLVCHVDHCVGHGGGEQQNAAPWVSCGGPEGATKCRSTPVRGKSTMRAEKEGEGDGHTARLQDGGKELALTHQQDDVCLIHNDDPGHQELHALEMRKRWQLNSKDSQKSGVPNWTWGSPQTGLGRQIGKFITFSTRMADN